MQKILYSIYTYVKYLLSAKPANGHRIHSPYIFRLATEVILEKKKTNHPEIENIRKKLYGSKQILRFSELGAGSKMKTLQVGILAKRSSVSSKYGRLLRRLAQFYQPSGILEIGTSFGLSTMYLATACPRTRLYTLEGNEEKCLIARENFDLLGLKNVEVMQGMFDDNLPVALNNIKSPLFVFYDGNHSYEPTIKYFEWCLTKSDTNSIFVFDDIHWSEEMKRAWGYIQCHPVVKVTIDLYYMGLVLFKKELQKQNFVIRF
jgi:predicted O-methyltransferase YrrM